MLTRTVLWSSGTNNSTKGQARCSPFRQNADARARARTRSSPVVPRPFSSRKLASANFAIRRPFKSSPFTCRCLQDRGRYFTGLAVTIDMKSNFGSRKRLSCVEPRLQSDAHSHVCSAPISRIASSVALGNVRCMELRCTRDAHELSYLRSCISSTGKFVASLRSAPRTRNGDTEFVLSPSFFLSLALLVAKLPCYLGDWAKSLRSLSELP